MTEQATPTENRSSNKIIIILLIVMIVLLGGAGAYLTVQYIGHTAKIKEQTKTIEEKEKVYQDAKHDLDSISGELTRLQNSGMISGEEAQKLRDQIAELEKDLEYERTHKTVVSGGGGTKARITELEGLLRTKEEEYNRLLAQKNTLEQDNKKLTGEKDALNVQNQELNVRNKDLQNKVDLASALKMTGATLTGYRTKKNGDKLYEEKTKKMVGLQVQFTILSNAVAPAGDRTAYIVITGPNKKVLSEGGSSTFPYMGIDKVYTVKKDFYYNNEDTEIMADYKAGEKLVPGEYRAEVYVGETLAGYCTATFK